MFIKLSNFKGYKIQTAWEAENGGDCGVHVKRGGSWRDILRGLRSACRNVFIPATRKYNIGFRLAQDVD